MLKMTIGYRGLQDIAKASRENYEQLKAQSDANGGRLGSYEAITADIGYYDFKFWINSVEDLPDWILKEASFERPAALKLIKADSTVDTTQVLQAVKMNQVHLPGNELLKLEEVTWYENGCTQQLQNELNEGWRIIAVCIQPGQRRPDYVLGRKKPMGELHDGPF